ncbi:MAG: hypothetical protein JSV17_16315 [Candidatus Aminicenantes bacterium]|nr:MAG: hypothetical protein JSV17_16315 [Candidatus Aminicenantes bacterium]
MDKKFSGHHLGIVVMLGAVWGLSEAALGMGLRNCASAMSGSIMTGVALFFIAACWVISQSWRGVALLVIVASLFKLFDALLLSLPILHGAVANPIFAFVMEGVAFLIIVSLVKDRLSKKTTSQALTGGLSALVAVNLFPLVKFATGIPACVAAGTGYPLSLYYAYIAVALSFITVPFGILAGEKMRFMETGMIKAMGIKKFQFIVSPAAVILCLMLVLLIRSI